MIIGEEAFKKAFGESVEETMKEASEEGVVAGRGGSQFGSCGL